MIVLINPNSTEAMTQTMLTTASEAVPSTVVAGWTSHEGPAAIQGEEDGQLAVPPMLELVKRASNEGARAIIIGCFDDTGLHEARELAECPVVGIGQAAYHLAAINGGRFSVVTTLPVSVPILQSNIEYYHLNPYLARVRASGVPVLELEHNPKAAAGRIIDEIKLAEAEDDISSIVLGCGGMAWLPEMVQKQSRLKVIDGVRAGAILASALAR